MTAFVVGIAVALTATPIVVRVAHRWELIDVPNHRSLHSAPVPRGGGLAILIATVASVAVAVEWTRPLTALVVASVSLGAVGLADDRLGLAAMPRLALQLGVPLVFGLLIADQVSAWLVVAAVLVAGYVNAFNFMDGINGISGSQAGVAGAFLALVADDVGSAPLTAAGWAVCGASLGFLPYNAVRPRIFLGDVGSYFLGCWLAALAILIIDVGAPAIVVVGPFLLYLADTSTVLIRRARRGEHLTEAHREHAYQRLVQVGWSHLEVAVLCAAISAVCAAIMYLVIDDALVVQLGACAACTVLVACYVALPTAVESRAAASEVA